MKKALKLLSLLMTSLLVSVINVKAAIKPSSYSTAGYFGNEAVLNAKLNVNGIDTTAYCHNPGVLAFTDQDVRAGNNFVEKRKLGDTKNGTAQNIYDAGLMSILTNDNRDNGNANFSMAKYIAVNLYEQLFPMFNTNANNSSSQVSYLKYIVNNQIYDSANADLKTLASKMGKYNIISSKMSGAKNCSDSNCGSQSDINSAVSMVKTALKAAVNYANNGEATATIGNAIQKRTMETDDSGKTIYKDTATHTITIASFGESNGAARSVKLNFNCADCNNVTTKFYINDQEITKDLSSIEFLDYTNNGSGMVQLKIEFTGTTCKDINYTLSTTYTHYTVSRSGYSTAKCTNSNKCQGFYVADASSTSRTKTTSIDNKISLCQTNGTTSSCTAKIDNVECVACKKNEHDVDIIEGYKYANDNVCDTSGASLNISECIANDGAVDSANHTYKNSELSEDTKSHNAGVFCKEDYHLQLPGSILVDTGRYFTLKSSITGTESCYTNNLQGSKTVASTKSTITSLGKQTVDAYNEIQKYKAIAACTNDNSLCNVEKTYDRVVCDRLHVGKVLLSTYRTFVGSDESDTFRKIIRKWQECSVPDCKYDKDSKTYWSESENAVCTCNMYVEYERIMFEYTPVINMSGSYDTINSNTCKSSSLQFNESFDGDPLGCGKNQDENGDFTGITDSQYLSALQKIGRQASGHWVGGSSVPGKVMGSGGQWVGESGSGLSVNLGTGGVMSAIDDWNKATGYSDATYGNDFDNTPFNDGWRMNYNFAPDMYFWYQEEYMNKVRTDQMDMYDKSLGNVTSSYCSGYVSDDYQKCYSDAARTVEIPWSSTPSVDRGSVCICWGPNAGDCGNKNYVLSNVRYVKQSQKAEAKFITPTQFYTLHPSGSIVVGNQGQSDKIENSKELTNGLPVGLGSNGTRRYVLWVENLGEYFDKDTLGRVWGANDSVVSKLLQDRTKCNVPDSALVDEDNTQGVIHDEGVYACKYSTDCPDVCKKPEESSDGKYHCKDGEVCEEEDYNRECCPTCPPSVSYICAVTTDEKGDLLYYDKSGTQTDPATYKSQCCPDGECPVTCSFCLYDNGKLNVQYRPITTEDLNPNDRDLGRNWNWEEPINTGLELKAYVTTEEIQEKGDGIYDIPDDHFTNPDSEYEYAVKINMNGRMISKIKSLNKKDEYKDGYAGNTLKCYDLKDGDKVYENVFCYSNFIDELLEDDKVKDNIQFTRVRPKENERNNTENNERYFTSWIKADSSKWQIQTQKGFAYYKEHYGMEIDYDNDTTIDYHLGPSWK